MGADSREGLRDLSWGVQRLEAKLDRLIAAVDGSSVQPTQTGGPAMSQERSRGARGWVDEGAQVQDQTLDEGFQGRPPQALPPGPGLPREPGRPADGDDSGREEMKSMLSKIAEAVGVKSGPTPSDDAEDRRRIKERFKDAMEKDQNRRIREEETTKEKWLEYVFGICKPDGRIGKAGSRCAARRPSGRVRPCLVPCE